MQPNQLVDFFTVTVVKLWHTVDGLYMSVSPSPSTLTWLDRPTILAGSSSLPLTTSGMYSVAVAHTCGRYGSVAEKHRFYDLHNPLGGLTLISTCYRFTP